MATISTNCAGFHVVTGALSQGRRYLLQALLVTMGGCSHPDYPVTDHFDGKRFYNQDRTQAVEKGFSKLLEWKFSGEEKLWPEEVHDNAKPELDRPLGRGSVAVTAINHATDLVQFDGLTVLTDPIFSQRASPVTWAGPKRHRQPGVALEELPKIDIIVISHNHYDHLDVESLVALVKRDHPKILVPLGNKQLLHEHDMGDVIELDWWQSYKGEKFGQAFSVTLVPMQHWSARGVLDRSEALWGGYVVEAAGLKLLFAGDTGYNRQFKEIAERFSGIDVSILPIGAYAPRWFMGPQHMDPQQAVQAHQDLRSKLSIGTHFGTFQLTDEGIEDPVLELAKSLSEAKVSPKVFIAPKNGQTMFFP